MNPVFAVIGHPNEGKSSVVATLVENDAIRISSTPGETMTATSYPVTIDGVTVVTFVDTPGFQNPVHTVGWMRTYSGPGNVVQAFIDTFGRDEGMRHECELLQPIMNGAGIIYVVDASRPVRRVDLAEMDIVRMTGRPRMAILNCKTDEEEFLDEWKDALRQNFNIVRRFDALRATFAERMRLIESLRALEQDWEPALNRVVDAFSRDWKRRNGECAALVCDFLEQSLSLIEVGNLGHDDPEAVRHRLVQQYEKRLHQAEKDLHDRVCRLFRHDIRTFSLPQRSALRDDLFSENTWSVFGLSRHKLVAAAVAAGGTAGVTLDMVTLGHSLGLFTALGGLVGGAVGGAAALMQGRRLAQGRLMGIALGHEQVRVGPLNTPQWIYILLDRFLLHYWYVIHWSHAWRDQDFHPREADGGRLGLTSAWNSDGRGIALGYFKAITGGDDMKKAGQRERMRRFLLEELERLSRL